MKNFEKICMCSLNRIFGFEPGIAHRMLEHFGCASAIFKLSGKELSELFGPHSRYSGRINDGELEISAKELERLADWGGRFIGIDDEDYPELLKECEDAPIGLYIRSSSETKDIFLPGPMVAVVGTRDISLYGKEWCRRIIGALATVRDKPSIVSGLALGVDAVAHETALDAGLRTVAVMATGIDSVYPARHQGLASRIASTSGCALISDYPLSTAPAAVNFIRRNRIIAGLCGTTVLVESKEKGGGLITANLASSYSRDVFALPGRIDDLRSQGCNRLIQNKIAEPITNLTTFISSAGLGNCGRLSVRSIGQVVQERYEASLGKEEIEELRKIAEAVKKNRGATVDELCSLTGMPYKNAANAARILENDGFINMDLLQRCSINVKKDSKFAGCFL